MHNPTVLILRSILIIVTSFGVIWPVEKDILIIEKETMGILKSANNNYTDTKLLNEVNSILEKYPQNALAHQVRSKLLFYAKGDIENAVEEINITRQYLNSIPYHGDSLNQDLKNIYENIYQEVELLNSNIKDYYINLKFKIKGVKIAKLCRIEGANIIFQYTPDVFQKANIDQKTRFLFLKDKLRNATFYLSELDTETQELYFEISFFPYVTPIRGEPFSITINDEYRYHFKTTSRNNPPIEISWSSKYQLIESLPKNTIKLSHSEEFPIQIPTIGVKKPFTLIENQGYVDTYVPVQENKTLNIILNNNYPGHRAEKVLFKACKISVLVVILLTFYIVR